MRVRVGHLVQLLLRTLALPLPGQHLPELVHQEAADGAVPLARVSVLPAGDERHHALRAHAVDRVCPRQPTHVFGLGLGLGFGFG